MKISLIFFAIILKALINGQRLVLIGGYCGQINDWSSVIQTLDLDEPTSPLSHETQLHSTSVVHGGYAAAAGASFANGFHVVGGMRRGSRIQDSQRLHSVLNRSTLSLRPLSGSGMVLARAWHSMTPLNHRLYVCGGWNRPDGFLISCEWWSPQTRSWRLSASMMPITRSCHAAVLFRNRLVLIGGMGHTNIYLSHVASAQHNSINNDLIWTTMTSLKTARLAPAAAIYRDRVIVCGGLGFAGEVLNCESLDDLQSEWTIHEMVGLQPRYGAAIVLGNNPELLLIGGRSQSNFSMNTIQSINCDTNWHCHVKANDRRLSRSCSYAVPLVSQSITYLNQANYNLLEILVLVWTCFRFV